jgi:addiction module HigA family antidote
MFDLSTPKNDPIAAGKIIEEEYRRPLGFTQLEFAKALRISRVRYAEIASGKRGITIDTAFRLGGVLGTSPRLWLNIQLSERHVAHAAFSGGRRN